MKLIIQIPCYNEEKTLPVTYQDLPKEIQGIDIVETLIIDDGSTDRTVEVAKKLGINHIVKVSRNQGLANAFKTGMDACLKLGADIIVNTDGDNQYDGNDIPKLIQPILEEKANIVIGCRQIGDIKDFSFIKKGLQGLGSWVVRKLSGTEVPDATSGFRAFSREAALRLNVISNFSYTLETIIQAGKKNIALSYVTVRTNKKLRESRLFTNIPKFIQRSAATMLRVYATYEPLKIFTIIGCIPFGIGLLLGLRFLYFFFILHKASGKVQSLLLASVLLLMGFILFMIGLVADLISANRRLLEDAIYRIKKLELDSESNPVAGRIKNGTDR